MIKKIQQSSPASSLLAIVLSVAGMARADITGKVLLAGAAPEMPAIDMSAVKECAQQHPDPVTDETVVVGEHGELKNVVVSIKPTANQDIGGDPPKTPATLDQKGCMYSPHVLAMVAGQDLVVKNSDPFLHNVHSMSSVNPAFNKAQPTANDGEKMDLPLKEAETFRVKCDVHPWMTAWVCVFEHPYFSVTGDDGTFTIKNLPDGTYALQAWHEKYGVQTQSIVVKAGKTERAVEFSFKSEK